MRIPALAPRLPQLFLAVLTMPLSVSAALTAPVKIETGLVQGVPASGGSVTAFKGIPFAAPPVADLRWRAPKPAAPWEGVRKAAEFSNACIQDPTRSQGPWTEEYMHQGEYSEDCLYLNVWTAAASARERRPVLVWIYGGAFTGGSTAVALYDGEELARKGIVVVSMNYRVGLMGFLAHPGLTRESDVHSSGNYGLLDQVAALQWVQKNIAAFGGDPKRVTIAGQSAGAAAVTLLTASPLAKGLFQQAIVQSGSRVGNRSRRLSDAEAEGTKFAEAKGAHSVADLRAMPVAKLTSKADGVQFRTSPVMDGWFLPDDVSTIFAKGAQNDVPTMTGWTADEGSSNATYGKLTAEEFTAQARRQFATQAGDFLSLYPIATPEQLVESQKASAREQNLISTFLWGRERAKTAKTKVYTYYWEHAQPGPKKDVYGAFHSSELAYVFNSLKRANRPWEPADREISRIMSSYWANFVSTGDPNGKGLAKWAPFNPDSPVTMELGDKFGPRPLAEPAKLKLFEAFFANSPPAR